jgi:uncharacterized C2H2 Zn-finger protein
MSEGKSLAIYNCQTCMFITKNKKDYERHLRSKKHQDASLCKIPVIEYKDTNTNKKDTYIDIDNDNVSVPMCSNCKKVYKSRTSIYTHMKTCGVAAPAAAAMTETRQIASPETLTLTLTPEQIQHILIENRILKELLKNVIQGINPPILAGPK